MIACTTERAISYRSLSYNFPRGSSGAMRMSLFIATLCLCLIFVQGWWCQVSHGSCVGQGHDLQRDPNFEAGCKSRENSATKTELIGTFWKFVGGWFWFGLKQFDFDISCSVLMFTTCSLSVYLSERDDSDAATRHT